ncbi:MAG: DUF975 family protein [Oscillospiraceae bacterium]|nr:DUF975 family protein [Oscillospiraceae bacterium]
MRLPDSCRLKNAAAESIKNANGQPGKLVVFHTAVILALSLAALAVDWLLEQGIGNTGGLDGVGMRAVLTTVQRALMLAQIIALPFWQLGWLYATVKTARGERTGKKDLLEGFRQFFPYLRLTVLKGLIYFGLAFGAAYAASFITMLLPFGSGMDLMDPNLTEAELFALMEQIAVPMSVISAVLSLVLCVPFFYRFRMAEYCLLDDPRMGARAALRGSRQRMQGNLWQLVRLDLSFWWYWLLTALVSALGWADVLLPLAGIELPWRAEVSYLAAYLLSAAAQLVLYCFCKAKVDVTYAHAYLTLLPKEENADESH